MMAAVKRYYCAEPTGDSYPFGAMEADPCGEWVAFDDYAAAMARAEHAEDEMETSGRIEGLVLWECKEAVGYEGDDCHEGVKAIVARARAIRESREALREAVKTLCNFGEELANRMVSLCERDEADTGPNDLSAARSMLALVGHWESVMGEG